MKKHLRFLVIVLAGCLLPNYVVSGSVCGVNLKQYMYDDTYFIIIIKKLSFYKKHWFRIRVNKNNIENVVSYYTLTLGGDKYVQDGWRQIDYKNNLFILEVVYHLANEKNVTDIQKKNNEKRTRALILYDVVTKEHLVKYYALN